MTLFILLVVTIILISITYRLGKSFHLGVSIHLHLKRELKQVRKKLSFWKDHPAKQFEVLQPIYRRVSYAAFRHNNRQTVRIEKKVNDELNLLIKNKVTSFYASCLLVLKGIVVLIGLFFSLGSTFSVYEEYQITSFEVDAKPIIQSVTGLGQAFNQWFTSIEWESESEVEATRRNHLTQKLERDEIRRKVNTVTGTNYGCNRFRKSTCVPYESSRKTAFQFNT